MPLDIEENLTENLEAALKSGRIDAAIVALPFAPPGVVTEFLYEEPFQDRRAARPQVGAAQVGRASTSSPASTRSCSTSATASASRCSTPARSSIAPTRT